MARPGLLLAAAVSCLLSGCGSGAPTTTTPPATPSAVSSTPSPVESPPVGNPPTAALVYALGGSGSAQISYSVGSSATARQETVTLPWRVELSGADAPVAALLNATLRDGADVSCVITREGAVTARAHASGVGAAVRCASSR